MSEAGWAGGLHGTGGAWVRTWAATGTKTWNRKGLGQFLLCGSRVMSEAAGQQSIPVHVQDNRSHWRLSVGEWRDQICMFQRPFCLLWEHQLIAPG